MKILVVDDHALIRDALRTVVAELVDGAVPLEAADSQEAMHLLAQHPDIGLVLLDLNLPYRDGYSVLMELRERHPEIAVVILSGQQDRDSVMKCLDLGAVGFIPKTGHRRVIVTALQLVLAGGIYIPPEVLAQQPAAPSWQRPRVGPADLGLTGRQWEVLALIMQGKSNKLICRALNLAEPTVKNHVTAILRALKVTNRTEAAISAREFGWDTALDGAARVALQVAHSVVVNAPE
jgi:DNA-binding NarL/FixJ family response regulator